MQAEKMLGHLFTLSRHWWCLTGSNSHSLLCYFFSSRGGYSGWRWKVAGTLTTVGTQAWQHWQRRWLAYKYMLILVLHPPSHSIPSCYSTGWSYPLESERDKFQSCKVTEKNLGAFRFIQQVWPKSTLWLSYSMIKNKKNMVVLLT